MAIDFTLSPELEQLRLRVRDFIDRVVKPGEAQITDRDDIERAEYLRILIGMRAEAQKAGKGAVSLDGKLIDAASIKQAEVMVKKAELIGANK